MCLQLFPIYPTIPLMNPTEYFDWAATSPMSEHALQAYCSAARQYIGNPSSLHREGQEAKRFLSQLRSSIASMLHADPSRIYFTSGGSESNAIILNSLLQARQSGQVIIPRFEHASITEYERVLSDAGWTVKTLQCPGGYLSPAQLQDALTPATRMVVCMTVNNVTGTIQPIKELVQVVRSYSKETGRNIHFHTDCVQAVGKIPVDLQDLGVDSASVSAHKFQGPRGTGVLYNANPSLAVLSHGGGQERGMRPGTEAIAAIAAMEAAMSDAIHSLPEHSAHALAIRTVLERELGSLKILSPSVEGPSPTSPYVFSISVEDIPSEVFTRMLQDKGYCVSSGSACSNNAKGHGESILQAMGVSAKSARSAIRISFGYDTTLEAATDLARTICDLHAAHSRFGR